MATSPVVRKIKVRVAIMVDQFGHCDVKHAVGDDRDPATSLSSRLLSSNGAIDVHVFEAIVALPKAKLRKARIKKATGAENGGDEIEGTLGRLGLGRRRQ